MANSSITAALIYTRVNTEDQASEGVSLDAQLAACRQYVKQHSWLIRAEHQDILTGKRDDRRAYQALLAEIRERSKAGERLAVLVMRLDRLGRRVLERVRCREELKKLGVPTHSVADGGEVSDFVANIIATVAEEEVRILGERVSDAHRHIAASGWWSPGLCPWGYVLRPAMDAERATGAPRVVLEPDPATAPYVRKMFERVASGEPIRSVARWAGRCRRRRGQAGT